MKNLKYKKYIKPAFIVLVVCLILVMQNRVAFGLDDTLKIPDVNINFGNGENSTPTELSLIHI